MSVDQMSDNGSMIETEENEENGRSKYGEFEHIFHE